MLHKLFGNDYQRRRLLSKTDSTVMKDYLSRPFPKKTSLISEVSIVSLDIETTGLDPVNDRIVSIGLVAIERLEIKLNSCWHQVIQTKRDLPESSVIIHQITDDQTATGANIEEVVPKLLERLSGKVMLAHNSKIELRFINNICRKLYHCDFIVPIVDTQNLAKRSFDRRNEPYKTNDLRLFNLHKSYNMPSYKAHNALMDAIATAELFLATVSRISPKKDARLAEILV